jgi:hypothetical protein
MDSLHTTLILPAHARANRAARDARITRAAFLRDIAAIVSERSEGACGAVRESGHGFGTLKAAAERAVALAGGVFRFGSVVRGGHEPCPLDALDDTVDGGAADREQLGQLGDRCSPGPQLDQVRLLADRELGRLARAATRGWRDRRVAEPAQRPSLDPSRCAGLALGSGQRPTRRTSPASR